MTNNRKRKRVEISKKQRALEGSVNKRSVGHKYDRMDIVDKEAPLMDLDKGISREPKNCQPAQGIKKQESYRWTRMKLETGTSKNFWRDPDAKFCCICGDEEDKHVELMCPYRFGAPPPLSSPPPSPTREEHIVEIKDEFERKTEAAHLRQCLEKYKQAYESLGSLGMPEAHFLCAFSIKLNPSTLRST